MSKRRSGTIGQGLTEYAILIATVSLGLILLLGSFRNASATCSETRGTRCRTTRA